MFHLAGVEYLCSRSSLQHSPTTEHRSKFERRSRIDARGRQSPAPISCPCSECEYARGRRAAKGATRRAECDGTLLRRYQATCVSASFGVLAAREEERRTDPARSAHFAPPTDDARRCPRAECAVLPRRGREDLQLSQPASTGREKAGRAFKPTSSLLGWSLCVAVSEVVAAM